jgi:phosphoesterase RecJ-like protein
MNDVIDFIDHHNSFAVFSHINPDGDALGSAYALASALLTYRKKAVVFLLENPPHKYDLKEFKPLFQLFPTYNIEDFDAHIAVDCGDRNRLGKAKDIFRDKPCMNLDHHISNNNFADVNYIKDAPATGEIIYDIMGELSVPVLRVAQLALYAAIASDTGNFTYANTTPKSLRIFSGLMDGGLDVNYIANRIFNDRSLGATRLICTFIQNMRLYMEDRLSISTIMLEDIENAGAKMDDCETLINYARDVDTVELAIFIRELKKDVYKISLRSKNESVDVAEFASFYGGGGHKRAAGCLMKGNIHDIMQDMIRRSEEFIG